MCDIEVYIGPNGFGKTTKLNAIKANLIESGTPEEDILFFESEIIPSDQAKDTIDDSKTMEYILFDLFGKDEDYLTAKRAFEDAADKVISDNCAKMNKYVDDILEMNDQTRSKDFIACGKKSYKNMVKIDSTDLKKKIGSGQRMQLLLRLACSSSKTVVFLDEPEKYSHPSMLHETARLINEFASRSGKRAYVATHSPKLLTMLDFEYENLYIINDSSHRAKSIDFNDASIGTFSALGSCVASIPDYEKRYYNDADSLKNMIRNAHHRDFLEALFTRRVFLCEGSYDEVFINWSLRKFGHEFEDYCVFRTNGKFPMPALLKLFSNLDIKVSFCFDEDDETVPSHKGFNKYLREAYPGKYYCFTPKIEDELEFPVKKKNFVASLMEHLETVTSDPKYDFFANTI